MTSTDLETLDESALTNLIRAASARGDVFKNADQDFLVSHQCTGIRRTFALSGRLSLDSQVALSQDLSASVLFALVSNEHAPALEQVQHRILERYRAGAAIEAVTHLVETTTHESVQLALLDELHLTSLGPLFANRAMMSPRSWTRAMVRLEEGIPGSLPDANTTQLFLMVLAQRPDVLELPDFVQAAVRASVDHRVRKALVKNPAVPLSMDMPVALLCVCERGRAFLEENAPLQRDAWNALLPQWEGSVAELLAACEHFAPA